MFWPSHSQTFIGYIPDELVVTIPDYLLHAIVACSAVSMMMLCTCDMLVFPNARHARRREPGITFAKNASSTGVITTTILGKLDTTHDLFEELRFLILW